MPADMNALADDVAAETVVLRELVASLDEQGWRQATPAPGWSIADQVSHLAHFDEAATESAARPREFSAELAGADAAGRFDPDAIAERYRTLTPAALLEWFDEARSGLLDRVPPAAPVGAGPVVRHAHERCVVADRPADGDLGARPGHRRRAGHPPGADRRGSGTWRTSAWRRGRSASPAAAGRCRSSRYGSSCCRPGWTCGCGARRKPPTGSPAARWTSAWP